MHVCGWVSACMHALVRARGISHLSSASFSVCMRAMAEWAKGHRDFVPVDKTKGRGMVSTLGLKQWRTPPRRAVRTDTERLR